MSRYSLHCTCTAPGCKDYTFYAYETVRDLREGRERNKNWLCVRHSSPEKVLSPSEPERVHVLIARRGAADRLFWTDSLTGGTGFTFGPGFKAFADDFPEGSRLVVTARVEAPEEQR